jgi:hypothetical protein
MSMGKRISRSELIRRRIENDAGPRVAPSTFSLTSQAARLRAAGLRVTSSRMAVMRIAPEVLARHGQITPRTLSEAAVRSGYAVNEYTLYRVLVDLVVAGLLPAVALSPPDTNHLNRTSQTASASLLPDELDDDHAI